MFVALRELRDKGPDGATMVFRPGDEVTSFAAWPYINQMAALNQNLVREVNLPQPGQPLLPMHPDEVDRSLMRLRTQTIGTPPQFAASVPAPESQASKPDQPEDDALEELVAPASFSCKLCSYSSATPAGLKIHHAKAHRQTG